MIILSRMLKFRVQILQTCNNVWNNRANNVVLCSTRFQIKCSPKWWVTQCAMMKMYVGQAAELESGEAKKLLLQFPPRPTLGVILFTPFLSPHSSHRRQGIYPDLISHVISRAIKSCNNYTFRAPSNNVFGTSKLTRPRFLRLRLRSLSGRGSRIKLKVSEVKTD